MGWHGLSSFHDRNKWQALVNKGVNLVPYTVRHFVTKHSSFSGRALLHIVNGIVPCICRDLYCDLGCDAM